MPARGETIEISSVPQSRSTSARRRQAGADAIHPGYGFLAENPDFAAAIEAAGLTWVGPPAEALRLGGDKLEAKRIARRVRRARRADGDPTRSAFRSSSRRRQGRRSGHADRTLAGELDDALAAAEREAKAAFGDGTVFCERYLERPRHVEIQLLADGHGTVLALGERDCSVQRRHQKLLEESPSPALDPERVRR